MLKYNIKLFFRNIKKDKLSFFINLIGLATGLACFFLICLWVSDELSFDKFHENDNRLYQAMLYDTETSGDEVFQNTPGLLAKALKEEMPEVEYATSVISSNQLDSNGIISNKKEKFKAKEQYVEKDFFNIFSYKTLIGNSDDLFLGTNNVMISEQLAKKLFVSKEDAIGKAIDWDKNRYSSNTYNVIGVFQSPPENSTEQFDIIFNYDIIFQKNKNHLNSWGNANPYTFLTLHNGINAKAFNSKIKGFLEAKSDDVGDYIFVRPYSDKYLYNTYENGTIKGGRIAYVRLFSIIGFFILLIACINYINLSTAQADKRLKEVGVKKVIGANRNTLSKQILSESTFLTLVAFIFSLGLIMVLLPQFNLITGKNLNLNIGTTIILLILTIVMGVISGIYPALYISNFKPIAILKGHFFKSKSQSFLRKGLVIFQFCISIVLIISVWATHKQLNFLQTKNLGYNKENVISFKSEGGIQKDMNTFLLELNKIAGVSKTTNALTNLTGDYGRTHSITYGDWNLNSERSLANMAVGLDFFKTLGIEVKEGRAFSQDFTNENSKIVLNEAAVKLMGIKKPIGEFVKYRNRKLQIVGVVNDFNFESLYSPIKPSFFRFLPSNRNRGENIFVKINAVNVKQTLANIENLYSKFNSGLPFDFTFLDSDYQKLYESENRISILSSYFAFLAIIISCLGLFGLVAYTVKNRAKEISIRKVFGSTVFEIARLLSMDFLKLVIVALLISTPLAYVLINKWLQSFAYHINMTWWMFGFSGVLVILIALVTLSFQSIKAANINLRTE